MSDVDFWRARLGAQVAKLSELMAADARAFVERLVREAFVAHPELEVEAATAKALAHEHGAAAADAVHAQLSAAPWAELSWEGEPALEEVGPLAEAARALQAAGEAALRAAGLPAPPASPAYSLPRRFIAGDNLVSLVRGVARAAQGLRQQQGAVSAEARGAGEAARRRAWDEA